MKMLMFTTALIITASSYANAATKWSNCPLSLPEAKAIQEIFWKSDVNGEEHGPSYQLSSGQELNNAGVVCADHKISDLKTWNSELKAGINPAKSVTSFKFVKNSQEFRSFLKSFNTEVSEPEKLDEAVTEFLNTSNRVILVGSSAKQAVIALASNDGMKQIVTFLQLKVK
ncbi:MAG: hypothetical protein ACXVCY_01605 [Pseudobdellovibrionaceae bacterium]